jgi:hypothetical protein
LPQPAASSVSPATAPTSRRKAISQEGDQILDGIGETGLVARYVLGGHAEDASRNHLHAALRGSGARSSTTSTSAGPCCSPAMGRRSRDAPFTIDGVAFEPFYQSYGRYSVSVHVVSK